MHSGARQEICIILKQMMILFIGELNRSRQRFQPEKISEWEKKQMEDVELIEVLFYVPVGLSTCGT